MIFARVTSWFRPRPSPPHIEIRWSADRQWYYCIVGANGQAMATSETYTRKSDAVRAVDALLDNPPQSWSFRPPVPPVVDD